VCGGCRFQDLAYEVQVAEKERQVRDALVRIGRFEDPPLEPIVPAASQYGYRNKLEYSFTSSEGGADLGFHRAGRWDEVRSLYVDDTKVETALLGAFGEHPPRNLLDIGTGTGRVLQLFAPRIGFGLGIDLSREMLSVARANLDRTSLRNCQVRHGDMYHLPLPGASFEAATMHNVLHFADDPGAALAEAARALRPGGRLVVVDFARHELEFLRREHAHRRLGFTDAEMRGWFTAAGLTAEPPVRLAGDALTVVVWAARRSGEAAADELSSAALERSAVA
jgi:ArsR family transcriptional regulator